MLQRGYIIIIIGAALLISGLVISAFWASTFASSFLRQGTILSGIAVAPSGSASNTIQVTDISHPIALQVHVESASSSVSSQNGQGLNTSIATTNNSLKEAVKDPTGKIQSQNAF
jgi:hypothetical protein